MDRRRSGTINRWDRCAWVNHIQIYIGAEPLSGTWLDKMTCDHDRLFDAVIPEWVQRDRRGYIHQVS